MGFSKINKMTIFLMVVLFSQMTFIVRSSPSGDNIIITEVLYDTPGTDSNEEWFELFNPTNLPINLTGWTIEDNADTFTLSKIIPAKGYLVIAKQATGFYALYGFNPDIEGLNLFLGNSGDRLVLKDNNGTEVDKVAWEEGLAGWSISATHTTIRRKNVVDTDTVDDWENSGSLGDPSDGPYDEMLTDSTPPLVEILSPLSGATVSGTVEISVNATDASGIASYEIYIDGVLKSKSASDTYFWNSRTVSNGSHIILARCIDLANNVGEDNVTVTVDNAETVSPSNLIKIMSYNIEESGVNPDWKEVVKEENPDIVIFIETGIQINY